MASCPCFGCEERTDVCHGDCKKYSDWGKGREKAKDKRRAMTIAGAILYDGAQKAKKRLNLGGK